MKPELKVMVSRWAIGDRNIQPPTAKVQKGKQRARMRVCNRCWIVQEREWAESSSPAEPKMGLCRRVKGGRRERWGVGVDLR